MKIGKRNYMHLKLPLTHSTLLLISPMSRHYVISRLPSLCYLDDSRVTSEEREAAVKVYGRRKQPQQSISIFSKRDSTSAAVSRNYKRGRRGGGGGEGRGGEGRGGGGGGAWGRRGEGRGGGGCLGEAGGGEGGRESIVSCTLKPV